ncbi:hypothetical protein Ppro_3407 [Pelobacter propionicus DSM 2379]|uniref:Uncharacterized protein n=1 Tax=Pelobacter propionicus (strain DSM 2379 / NBRC 103807 / OttBd1) TaxID=338966 RepID=A1AUH9_PELPD|nr:hypothetical protein Ppro_3407 [Pelobacter propionicus DSM 2379]
MRHSVKSCHQQGRKGYGNNSTTPKSDVEPKTINLKVAIFAPPQSQDQSRSALHSCCASEMRGLFSLDSPSRTWKNPSSRSLSGLTSGAPSFVAKPIKKVPYVFVFPPATWLIQPFQR